MLQSYDYYATQKIHKKNIYAKYIYKSKYIAKIQRYTLNRKEQIIIKIYIEYVVQDASFAILKNLFS